MVVMLMLKNRGGFTVLEAVASIFIITLVLTTAMSIILTMRNNAIRSEEKIKATDIGALIRYDLENDYTYEEINTWLNGEQVVLTNDNCSLPFNCQIFSHTTDEKIYDDLITITFLEPTLLSETYEIIHFEISIIYYKDQVVTLVGAIYA